MVFIPDVWNELWSKSRKMIVNRSFRQQKRNRQDENNRINKEIKTVPSTINNSYNEVCLNINPQTVNYKKSNKTYSTATFTGSIKKTPNNNINFDDDSEIYITIEPSKVKGGMKKVKCHIYEQVTPKIPEYITTSIYDCNDEVPNVQIHYSTPESPRTDRLIKDENGVSLSPIVKSTTPKSSRYVIRTTSIPGISPLRKVEKSECRRNLEDRFVVNAYRAGCWQRLSKRKQSGNINDTKIIKVRELYDAGGDKRQVNTKQNDVEVVGELYRARITPDKILPTKITQRCKERRRRVVPNSLLSMLDDNRETGDEYVKVLNKVASKMELNESQEPLYATPNKTAKNKKPSEMLTTKLESEKKQVELKHGDSDTFFKLKEEADYQCKIMRQASKALEVSRRSETSYVDVRGQVEAEKILLTANCKYEKVLQEIRQNHYEKPIESRHLGTIEISGITVGLTKNFTEEQTGWFVLIMMDEKRIFSTIPVDVQVGDKKITFDRTFYFDNLDGTFEITGKIYCLLHRKFDKKSESRFSSKLRLSSRKLRYMDLYTRDLVENNVVSSSFLPSGYFKLTVNDLHKSESSFKIITYENAPLNTKLDLKVRLAQFKIDIEKCGMVNLRSMTDETVWHRRWCTMTGTVLQFWNSPLDEAFNEPPIMIIDLVYCRKEIESANKALCPRAKTLALITSKGTYYINIDTIGELHEWKQLLNEVYSALCDWKMLKG